MRSRIPTSRETIEILERDVAELKRRLVGSFSAEEMDVIREQLAERVACVELERDEAAQAREEIEWGIRVELARVREAEAAALRAAAEMGRVAASIAQLLGEDESMVTTLRNSGRRRMFA